MGRSLLPSISRHIRNLFFKFWQDASSNHIGKTQTQTKTMYCLYYPKINSDPVLESFCKSFPPTWEILLFSLCSSTFYSTNHFHKCSPPCNCHYYKEQAKRCKKWTTASALCAVVFSGVSKDECMLPVYCMIDYAVCV